MGLGEEEVWQEGTVESSPSLKGSLCSSCPSSLFKARVQISFTRSSHQLSLQQYDGGGSPHGTPSALIPHYSSLHCHYELSSLLSDTQSC